MHNLLRYIRRNRKKIIIIIAEIAFLILLIQTIEKLVASGTINNSTNKKFTSVSNNTNANYYEKKITKSAISGKTISQEQKENISIVIKEFFDYCNNKDINSAYNMLSEECKKVMYPTSRDLYNNYLSYIFTEEKIYDLQNWIINSDYYTYKVTIMEDVMAKGTIAGNNKTDYYTVVKQKDGTYKININSYVGRFEINKELDFEDINIRVNYKDVFIDYEQYNISIKNNTKNTVLVANKNNTNAVYLEDSKEVKYYAYMHEIADNLLTINPNRETKIDINFNKLYNTDRKIEKIVFSDFVTNYQTEMNTNKENKSVAKNIELYIK